MFLSPNTLYLAVWNVTHGEEGVESLRRWLLNIQVIILWTKFISQNLVLNFDTSKLVSYLCYYVKPDPVMRAGLWTKRSGSKLWSGHGVVFLGKRL